MSAIYRRLIHRTEPNRPHISSDTNNFKQRRDKRNSVRPNLFGAPRLKNLKIFFRRAYRLSAFPLPSGPSGAPLERVCSSGKGGSTDSGSDPQPLFSTNVHFL